MSTETVTITQNTTPQPTLEEQAKTAGIDLNQVDNTAIEQPAEQRPSWLPEKFKTVEDFAKSYEALEKKLGSPKHDPEPVEPDHADVGPVPEVETPEVPEVEVPKDAQEAVDKAGLDYSALQTKYNEKGQIDPEDYAALEKIGVPKHLVDQYIEGLEAKRDLTRQTVFASVGGEANYDAMIDWARDNYTPAEVAAYDKMVNSSDQGQVSMAVQGLRARYQAEHGVEPRQTITGTRSTASDRYESIQELTEAMSDKRYNKDPAYTKRVEQKLARSDIF